MDQFLGIIRTVLLSGSGFAIAHGVATQTQWETIVAGLVAVISAVWGYFHRSQMIAAPAK